MTPDGVVYAVNVRTAWWPDLLLDELDAQHAKLMVLKGLCCVVFVGVVWCVVFGTRTVQGHTQQT